MEPTEDPGPERATFIFRLTRERREGANWRGEVQYVQRGERRPARDAATAFGHLAGWLEEPTGS